MRLGKLPGREEPKEVSEVRKPLIILVALIATTVVTPATASATTKSSEGGFTRISVGHAKLPEGVRVNVLPIKAKGTLISRRFRICLSRAEKLELPAPPRDPRSNCRGSVVVKAKVSARASCKPGYLGGQASATLNINERVTVRAFSQSVASGRAWTRAQTRIRQRIRGSVGAQVNCIKEPTTRQEPSPFPGPELPKPPVITCPDGTIVSSPASCNVQQNTAKQHCEVDLRGSYDEARNVCIITQVQGNCSIIIVVNGDGNVISTSGNELCNTQQPPCTSGCNPPPPERRCPEGQVGTYPDCRMPTCPYGTTGNYPDCRRPPTCPSGTTGSYPDCVPTCPPGNTWDRTKRQCVKDGSTTPDPGDGRAPGGTNPPPSPSDPAPGGHQCYSETTGRPVDPLPDGRCPVGSYGA